MIDKQINPTIKEKDRIEAEAKKKQEKEIKLLGKIFPHDGHTCFELNLETYAIEPCEYMEETVNYKDLLSKAYSKNRKVLTKPNHIYASALNKKNAAKAFGKLLSPLKFTYDKNNSKLVRID